MAVIDLTKKVTKKFALGATEGSQIIAAKLIAKDW